MRTGVTILLLSAVLAWSSGLMARVHDLAHAAEDAAAAAAACHHDHGHAAGGDGPSPAGGESHPRHHAGNCLVHQLLQTPAAFVGHVPQLVALGLIVAFVSALTPRPASRRAVAGIHCRGPPALA